jgi:hypothetical protein
MGEEILAGDSGSVCFDRLELDFKNYEVAHE